VNDNLLLTDFYVDDLIIIKTSCIEDLCITKILCIANKSRKILRRLIYSRNIMYNRKKVGKYSRDLCIA
jgi:hypothetical protein